MVVIGCQRSGTKTMSDIFGLTHEIKATPESLSSTFLKVYLTTIKNESSWLITPYARHIRDPIVRVIRHPMNVVRSLLGIDFWKGNGHELYRDFIFSHLPLLRDITDLPERSFKYWLEWNKMCDGYVTIRIEDIYGAPQLNQRKRFKGTLEIPEDIKEYMGFFNYA